VKHYERTWSERFRPSTTCWKSSTRRRREAMQAASSGTAVVTLPSDTET
jgi:hypothetical protein